MNHALCDIIITRLQRYDLFFIVANLSVDFLLFSKIISYLHKIISHTSKGQWKMKKTVSVSVISVFLDGICVFLLLTNRKLVYYTINIIYIYILLLIVPSK